MKQNIQPKQQPPMSASNRVRSWCLRSIVMLLLLIVATVLILPLIINSDSIKQKIQGAVTEQTNGQVTFQAIGFSYFPRLAVELHQVTVALPNQAQGTVASLRVTPAFLPLLVGNLHLARLELDAPQLSLELPDTKANKVPVQTYTFATVEKSLSTALEPFLQVISDLELRFNNARLTISKNQQKLVEIEGLNMQCGVSTTSLHSAQVSLQAKISKAGIYRNNHQEMVKNISLRGSVKMVPDGRITVALDRLTLAEPALELTGNMTMASTAPAITLNLSGGNIDVGAVRETALALAGNTTPIKEIFDYLRGGHVPRISFTSHGENLGELGDLDNILIEGQLQDGNVSIPGIKLDLTKVDGDVVISKGVLQGSRLSTRLKNSVGHEGSLKIGLAKDNDLFHLELKVDADLANTQLILQRIVNNPTFVAELKKITNLHGNANGRLILGDSLNDINAKIEVSDLQLSANSLRVPLPITISEGQFAYSKEKIDLGKLSGTLGQSHFDNLSCQFLWEKDLFLHISSGRLNLAMAELYPWLASLEGVRDKLKEVKQVTGQLGLSTLEFQGAFNQPAEWKFASSGTVKDLFIDTPLLPDTINLKSGHFNLDTQQFRFDKLQTASQDAALTLTGRLNSFLQRPEQIELSVDGQMGPQSVEWLSNALKVPKSYAIHAPISISTAKIFWQPDAKTSFNGAISIEKGPTITANVDYKREQLQLHQLTIKDQYSDAKIVVNLNKDQRELQFTGNLQHETLQAMFVDPQFSSSRLEGDFAVTVPQKVKPKVTTKGQLIGENLPVPLSSGDTVNIDQVTLKGDGSQVKVDITKLIWKGLNWEPVKATVSFNNNRTDIKFTKAKLCGIDSPGVFSITGKGFSLDMNLEGKGLDVATSYSCLTNGQVKMTGTLDFSSHVTATGQLDELVNALRGPLNMTFSNGLIEQDKLLSRTLEVLNVTEIVKGRLPNLASKGLAYTTMTLQGEFRNGKLLINNYFMDGETLDLIGNGELHLEDETINAQLLAAPFKTADTIVRNIPGINYILAGSLVTIPVSITGKLADPKVEVMSASAVGVSLYNLAKRTIKSPFKLLEMINPWGKQNKK